MSEFSGSEIPNDGRDGKEPIARPQTNTRPTVEIGPSGRLSIQGEIPSGTPATPPEAVTPAPDRQPTPSSSFKPDIPQTPRPSEVLSQQAIDSIRGV